MKPDAKRTRFRYAYIALAAISAGAAAAVPAQRFTAARVEGVS